MVKLFSFSLGAAILIAACAAPSPEAPVATTRPTPPPAPAVSAQLTGITKLYMENCAACHGANGEGGGGGTRTVLTKEKFDQKYDKPFFNAIKNGVPDMGMEAYGKVLSDADIWGLVVHLRELQARALRSEFGSVPEQNGIFSTRLAKYKIETVVDQGNGLRTPWGVDWLPDGTMLVTNRPGTMVVVKNGRVDATVEGLPESAEIGQGGLMEVAVHPDYRRNRWIYLGYTEPKQDNPRQGMTKIVRGRLQLAAGSAKWTDQQTIFELPKETYTGAGVHFGTRIVFDKGKLFFAIGDRGAQDRAQDLTRPNGKVFRVNDDGTIPADNPFVSADDKAKGHLPAIWSYGHRNPQGLVMDAEGNLWDTEHGPRGGDELNLVKKGANYGWPVVSFSINYNDSSFTTPWPASDQKLEMPAFRWLPSIGVCGMDVARGPAFPEWRGDLLAGGLSGQNVDRIRVRKGALVEREEIFHGQGRVREVAVGPDGFVYIALNQPDKIVRLVPAR